MKNNLKYIILIATVLAGFASCTEEIIIDTVDEDAYANVNASLGTLKDAQNGQLSGLVQLYDKTVMKQVAFNLSRAQRQGVEVEVAIDPSYLEEYNTINKTGYKLYPAEKVNIQNSGRTTVVPGEKKSFPLGIEFAPFSVEEFEQGVSYAIPFKVTTVSGGVASTSSEHLVYVVENHRGETATMVRADRKPGEKALVCYLEVNDTNPLNILQWETEDGRLLVSHVILFAYNINYDKDKGEVFISSNPQCRFILDHYDEIVKPLQERGVKVLMGLLGNHDAAGFAQLSPIGCKMFAKQVAEMCYQYGFDGINIDDEYSKAPDLTNPIFCEPSEEAGARLCLEIKKAMPDKLVTLYQLGSIYGQDYVDGIEQGYYMDMIFADYNAGAGYPSKGCTKANCSASSIEFARNQYYYMTLEQIKGWAASEYGSVMIFGPWAANRQGDELQFQALDRLAQGLLGSKLKTPEFYYPETKSFRTLPYNK